MKSAINYPVCRVSARGLTLIEVVLSTAVTAILMAGIASAILLATQALPDDGNTLDGVVNSADVLDQISSELACAVSVPGRTAAGIVFRVADRNGNALPETISYQWSGTAGEPLYRQYNGGNQVAVLEDVRTFELSYETITVSTTVGEPSESESDEVLLASCVDLINLGDRRVRDNRWLGQTFRPSLPLDTIRWKVTRILFQAARVEEATGQCMVKLYAVGADGGPTADVLAQLPLDESDLSDEYEWREFAFPDAPQVSGMNGLCFVIEHLAHPSSCKVRYRTDGVLDPDIARLESSNGGATWSVYANQSLLFYAYGTITTLTPGEVELSTQLTAVRIRVRVGDDDSGQVETSVHLLNTPEISE